MDCVRVRIVRIVRQVRIESRGSFGYLNAKVASISTITHQTARYTPKPPTSHAVVSESNDNEEESNSEE